MLEIVIPDTAQQVAEVRQLFQEYSEGLGIDLCFQNFEKELRELPGDYQEPGGALLLAQFNSQTAGCCALRPLKATGYGNAAEMKRLYVRPAFRGKGIANRLVLHILKKAKEAGYSSVLLDTLKTMQEAQALYKRLGFQEVLPYYENPIEGAKYLKLDLSSFDSTRP